MARQSEDDRLAFKSELENFEDEVGAPLVPGELRNWCRSLREALAALIRGWKRIEREEQARLQEILEVDLELAHRVEALQRKREELSATLDKSAKRIDELLEKDAEDPQGSWEPAEAAGELRESLLAWIVHCRVHEKEIETWSLEAIHRDRGDVD